jgi:hypothetical protein
MPRTATLALAIALCACWTDRATPAGPHAPTFDPVAAPTTEPSYRSATLAADAIGVGLLAAGTYGYMQRGGNDGPSSALFLAGGLTATFGAPLVHALHGHTARAGASYLFRSMFVSAGVIAGMEAGCGRGSRPSCELDPAKMSLGMIGGFVVAGALDALVLHGARSAWTPTVLPDDGGATVGLARLF